jgi:hypothetical protein
VKLPVKLVIASPLWVALANVAPAQTAIAPAALSFDNGSWLSPAEKLDTHLPHWLRFHGEERVRAEGAVGAGFKTDSDDGYMLNRIRLDMQVVPASWLKFDFQAQDARAFWRNQSPILPLTRAHGIYVWPMYKSAI